MSRYNEVYAEIRIKGKWYSLNPIVKNENDGSFIIEPIIFGQSHLTPFFEYARANCVRNGIPGDLSDDLDRIINPNEIIDESSNQKRKEQLRSCYTSINYDKLFGVVKEVSKSQYSGFVDEKEIELYEEDNEYQIETYYSFESFLLLTAKERIRLRYYEWDDYSYGSIYPICKEIIKIIEILKKNFLDYSFGEEYIGNEYYDIRLIVYGS